MAMQKPSPNGHSDQLADRKPAIPTVEAPQDIYQLPPLYSRRLLLTVLLLTILLLAAVALFNFSVDPYRVYGGSQEAGLNRPYAQTRVVLSKVVNLQKARPKTLLLGNSRVEVGVNPDSAAWPEAARPVFNAAIPGVGPLTNMRMLQTALSVPNPQLRQVYLAVDFTDFVGATAPAQPDWHDAATDVDRFVAFDARGRRRSVLPRWQDGALVALENLLSITATQHSVLTLLQGGDSDDLQANGFNPGYQYRAHVHNKGHASLFAPKQRELSERLNSRAPRVFEPGTASSRTFGLVSDIIALANTAQLQTTLFIHPFHLQLERIIADAGLGESYAQWKIEIVRRAVAGGLPGVWDFSGDFYNKQNAEPVPQQAGEFMQWYWEMSHYRAELGELMVARMQQPVATGVKPETGFGVLLTTANVEQYAKAHCRRMEADRLARSQLQTR